MSAELVRLYEDLDLEKLRIRRPEKFIFFCGGRAGTSPRDRVSLRHFLLSESKIGKKVKASIVLAERANQIYRDTKYGDLISFEEDIAVISSLVLVIVESAGSFAELGSFSSVERIRKSLLVIMQDKFESAESFVRFGPVQRIKNEDSQRVAFWPWRTNSKNKVIKSSAAPHVSSIVSYINDRVEAAPLSMSFERSHDQRSFLIVYWLLYLATAAPLEKLAQLLASIDNGLADQEIKKKLYCMKIAGWVGSFHYANIEYYFARIEVDPMEYSFKPAVVTRDTARRKFDVVTELKKELGLPTGVRRLVLEKRKLEPWA